MRALSRIVAAAVVALSACSSHEPRFERSAQPPPNTRVESERYAAAAGKLIEQQAHDISAQSPESLANLARASADVYRVTGAPRMRSIAIDAADRLLEGRVRVEQGMGLRQRQYPNRADPWLTSLAGLAFLEAHRISGARRHLEAARQAAYALVSPTIGWKRVRGGFALDDPRTRGGAEVAVTAQAALLLALASEQTGVRLRAQARGAFRVIRESQPAVGHWYATVGGKEPQTLSAWATTLLTVLSPSASAVLRGIGGAGVVDLWRATFGSDGEPQDVPLVKTDRAGVPLALKVLQEWPDERLAARAYPRARLALEENSAEAFGVSAGQLGVSRLAVAFARRAALTSERSQGD
jgi:hypothetical protein